MAETCSHRDHRSNNGNLYPANHFITYVELIYLFSFFVRNIEYDSYEQMLNIFRSMIGNNDVREPIAPIRGAIVEQTFAQQYGEFHFIQTC